MIEGTSIATFVDPRHDIDGCSLVSKRTDVLLDCHWVKQLQKTFNTHSPGFFKSYNNETAQKIVLNESHSFVYDFTIWI